MSFEQDRISGKKKKKHKFVIIISTYIVKNDNCFLIYEDI